MSPWPYLNLMEAVGPQDDLSWGHLRGSVS